LYALNKNAVSVKQVPYTLYCYCILHTYVWREVKTSKNRLNKETSNALVK